MTAKIWEENLGGGSRRAKALKWETSCGIGETAKHAWCGWRKCTKRGVVKGDTGERGRAGGGGREEFILNTGAGPGGDW